MIIEILILKKKKDCILKQNKNMSQQIGWRADSKVLWKLKVLEKDVNELLENEEIMWMGSIKSIMILEQGIEVGVGTRWFSTKKVFFFFFFLTCFTGKLKVRIQDWSHWTANFESSATMFIINKSQALPHPSKCYASIMHQIRIGLLDKFDIVLVNFWKFHTGNGPSLSIIIIIIYIYIYIYFFFWV